MFNLGIKQIVINSDAVVTSVAGTGGQPASIISVEGFGVFGTSPTGISDGAFFNPGVAPALGVYEVAMEAGVLKAGDIIDVRVYTNGSRVIGELWPYNTNSFIFQAVVEADDEFGTGMIKGQDGLGISNTVLQFRTGGDELTPEIAILAGYEGVSVQKVTYTMAGDSYTNVADAVEIGLKLTTSTIANEGINTGRMLEAEVRNATFENIDPYGIAFGGNSAVDVRALYTEVHWVTTRDDNGWEPHEMLGYGDANTGTSYAPRSYSAFVNEASAPGALAILINLTKDVADSV